MGVNKVKTKIPSFVLIEKKLLRTPEWIKIGKVGRDLYLELKLNFNGANNGRLIASYSYIRKKYSYGYETISQGFKKLIEYKFIEIATHGGLGGFGEERPNGYRLLGIHEYIRTNDS